VIWLGATVVWPAAGVARGLLAQDAGAASTTSADPAATSTPDAQDPGAEQTPGASTSSTATSGLDPTTSTSAPASTSTTSASSTTTSTPSSTSTTTTTDDAEPTSTTVADPGDEPEVTTTIGVRAVAPAVARTDIPVGSVVLAVVVLLVVGALVLAAVRRRTTAGHDPTADAATSEESDDGTPPADADRRAPPLAEGEHRSGDGAGAEQGARAPVWVGSSRGDRVLTLRFLLELGRALIDAGDPVEDVQRTVHRVGVVNGLGAIGVVVLPTALMISVPGADDVQTEVSTAGRSPLRLDQAEEVFGIVDEAEAGRLTPAQGLRAIERARRLAPHFGPPVRLLGAALFTTGSALMLRAGWADVVLAIVLGLGVGALQMLVERTSGRSDVDLRALWPLLAAFAVSVVAFSASNAIADVSPFAPIVAALVTYLPGGLLTTGVIELATGGLISGAGRLAAGSLRLALLAVGIIAAGQLVGVPASTIAEDPDSTFGSVLAWVGVGVFGLGIFIFHGGRRASLGWMVLVMYVAYAGQVVGGAFFGGSLSAFFGALAMTPFAIYGARMSWGPPMLVSFLPAFWLLVPGALGLEGVTRFIGGDQLAGLDVVLVTGSTMLGIALGVLLGTAVGTNLTRRDWRRLHPH
jgi:uncharacterized membrane protein YjjP (DUF1212 family)